MLLQIIYMKLREIKYQTVTMGIQVQVYQQLAKLNLLQDSLEDLLSNRRIGMNGLTQNSISTMTTSNKTFLNHHAGYQKGQMYYLFTGIINGRQYQVNTRQDVW